MSKKKNVVKKNSQQARDYAAKKQNEEVVNALKLMAISQQEILDAVALTLHWEFGYGPERQKRFHDKFEKVYGQLKDLERDDEPERVYYKETVERGLREALGPYYDPRDIRYDINVIDAYGNVHKV